MCRLQAFFVLDGFVTDHFGVLERESALLSALGAFEDDPKRMVAMHRRQLSVMVESSVRLRRP